MRNKKIGTWVATLLITMLTFMGLGQTMVHAVQVEGPLTDIIITKIETPDDVKDMDIDDLANGVDVADWFSGGSKVLPGVSFTYYNVSDGQLAQLRDGSITAANLTGGISTVETNEDGEVTIPNLPQGNYWVVENPKGTIVDSKAVPFWLILPFTNQDGNGYLRTVHVYPKNTLTDDEPNIEKTVDESNVAIGEVNEWTITVDIPIGIEDYDLFKVTDVIDTRLDFNLVDLVVELGNGNALVNGTDYDASFIGRDLVVNFTDYLGTLELTLDNEGNYNREKIVITYKTKVNDTAIMGQDIPNDATLDFNNGHGVDKDKTPDEIPSVHTGGKAFVKKANGENGERLAGAKFVIMDGDEDYVNVGANGVVTFVTDIEDATTFTSDADGEFEVKGLPYASYVLVETMAPQGYALPTDPNTDFKVDANSYYNAPGQIESGEIESDNPQFINNRRLVIPQTGGIGTVVFTVIGAVMMLFSALFYKRTKEA